MLVALALSLLLPAAAPATAALDPPIRLKLSHDTYERGDRARVRVKLVQDGYLLVLRKDANGRVRVLYPVDPEDAPRVRGGKEFEVRGRGDREAFAVDESTGAGTVVAVRSAEPFDFTGFLRGSRWDYRALSDSQSSGDAESALLDLADRMTTAQYDYDTVRYTVVARDGYRRYAGWYDPWYSGYGYYGPGYGYYGYGYGYSGYGYGSYGYGSYGYGSYGYGSYGFGGHHRH